MRSYKERAVSRNGHQDGFHVLDVEPKATKVWSACRRSLFWFLGGLALLSLALWLAVLVGPQPEGVAAQGPDWPTPTVTPTLMPTPPSGPQVAPKAALPVAPLAAPPGWEEPIPVAATGYESRDPDLFVGPIGLIHVVWAEWDTSPGSILYSRWDGVTWSDPFTVTTGVTEPRYPDIVTDSQGELHVVWQAVQSNQPYVFYSTSQDNGVSWATPLQLSSAPATGPRLAVDSADTLYTVWQQWPRIYWTRNEGSGWVAPAAVPPAGDDGPFSQAIATDGSNNLHLTWAVVESDNWIVYHSRWSGQEGWLARSRVSPWDQDHADLPAVNTDSGNRPHVVWYEDDNDVFHTIARSEEPATDLSNDPDHYSGYPDIVVDANDMPHAVWYDAREGDWQHNQILYTHQAGWDNWASPVNLSQTSENAVMPAIAAGPDGRLHVVWMDSRSGVSNIYYATREPVPRSTLEIGPLEQETLLNYTTLRGVPQSQPSRTTGVWTQEITSTWSTTITVPVSNTGTLTETGVIIWITIPPELRLLPDPNCMTCTVESLWLGDIPPGEARTARWFVAKEYPYTMPGGYTWPVSFWTAGETASAGAEDEIGVEKVYDSGYEMGRNAYYPINSPNGAYPTEVGPIAWNDQQRRWDIFREVFQDEVLPVSPYLAKPVIGAFYRLAYRQVFGAYCTGMSVSNGDRLGGCTNLPDCGMDLWLWSQQPQNEAVFKEEMERYQGKLLTLETMQHNLAELASAEVESPSDRNNEVLAAIRETVASNSTDRRVLQFWPKVSQLTKDNLIGELSDAHAVVPYLVTESAWGKRIYIYDPNKPEGNPNSPFPSINAVQISADGFFLYDGWNDKFDPNDPNRVLDILVTAPYPLYSDAGLLPIPYYSLFGVLSPVHLAVTDDQGRTTGIAPDGHFVTDIPGSGPMLGVPEEFYVVPAEEAPHVVASIQGFEAGTYTYFQFQGDGLFLIEDASAVTTTLDTVDVSTDGLALRYSTEDATKTYSAVLVKEAVDYGRVYTAAHTSLTAGEVVTFQVSADLSAFTYTNPGGAKQYDLGLEQTGVCSGAVLFPSLEIGANEAHIVSVEDWDHLTTSRITLGVDEGIDGSVDEIIVLQGGVILADDFDRPNSTNLGPDWVEELGDWDIVDGQLHAQVNGDYAVATTQSFSETIFTLETRFRATGSQPVVHSITLGFGAAGTITNPTGYGVTYIPAYGKLKLMREYVVLDQVPVTLVPDQWYRLKIERNGVTGSIEVYLDEGQGYPATPTLQATDSSYPELRRLGWTAGGMGYDLYVDWVVAQ